MSIRDYNKKFCIINGLTNERIVVPKTNCSDSVFVELDIDDYLLLRMLTQELHEVDSCTVCKTYMKDN